MGTKINHKMLRVLTASFNVEQVTCEMCLEELAQRVEDSLRLLAGPIKGRSATMVVIDDPKNQTPLPLITRWPWPDG